MAVPFSHTLEALEARGLRKVALPAAAGAVLITSLGLWLALAKIEILERSSHAQVEAAPAPSRLETEVEGTIATVHAKVGDHVTKGVVLLEIDSKHLQAKLLRLQRVVDTYPEQLATIEREIGELSAASEKKERAAGARVQSAVAASRGGKSELHLARLQSELVGSLPTEAGTDLERKQARLRTRQALAHSSSLIAKIEEARFSRELEQHSDRAEIERLTRSATALRREMELTLAELEDVERALDQHKIVAPHDGVIVGVRDITPGAVVQRDEWLITVAPPGRLRVMAEFSGEAVAKIHSGNRGTFEVFGFPWTQYGKVAVSVDSVSGEANGELYPVILEIDSIPEEIQLRHGHTGVAEVSLEKVSPALLLLRQLGWFSRR